MYGRPAAEGQLAMDMAMIQLNVTTHVQLTEAVATGNENA
jgi:hypothetical protein